MTFSILEVLRGALAGDQQLRYLIISINEDGDHLRVDAMSRQQRAQHPEEDTEVVHRPPGDICCVRVPHLYR